MGPEGESSVEYQAASERILAMAKADQEMRSRAAANRGIIETAENDTIDVNNTEELKILIQQIGWPTIPKVGEQAAHMAWLLVQHADHDVEWQKQCLSLMKSLPTGEAALEDIAYLEDRVRVNENRPQLYGTQFTDDEQGLRSRPIEDPDHVNERREKMGMEPLETYVAEFMKNNKPS